MPVQNALVKRMSRSETSTSGSPTSRNTDLTKLRAAVLAVAVLKVGTSHTRRVRRSMRTCRKSWPERATGNSRKSRLIHPPRRVGPAEGTADRPTALSPRQVVCLDALTRWAGAHVLFHRAGRPGHHTERRARASVLSRPQCPPRGVALRTKRVRGREGKAIAAPAAAVEQSVTADEGAARRAGRGGVLRLCRRRKGPQNWIRPERRANRGREVCVQKAGVAPETVKSSSAESGS